MYYYSHKCERNNKYIDLVKETPFMHTKLLLKGVFFLLIYRKAKVKKQKKLTLKEKYYTIYVKVASSKR